MPPATPGPSDVTAAAVAARVRREFPSADQAIVRSELDRYSAPSEVHTAQIQHAVLTLSAGMAEAVPGYIDAALADFRDVIYWAYSPAECRTTREAVEALIDRVHDRAAGSTDPQS